MCFFFNCRLLIVLLLSLYWKLTVALPSPAWPFESHWELTYDTGGESERGMEFDLAISSTAMANRLVTSVGRINFRWTFRWFYQTHLALMWSGKYSTPCMPWFDGHAKEIYCHFWGTFLGSFWWSAWRSFQPFHFCNWERNIERSPLKLRQQQGNKHMNKVCKFKLCYPREFRVSRSTKISHTFPYINLALWHMAHRSLGRLWSKQNRLTSARQNTPTKHDTSDWTDSKEFSWENTANKC